MKWCTSTCRTSRVGSFVAPSVLSFPIVEFMPLQYFGLQMLSPEEQDHEGLDRYLQKDVRDCACCSTICGYLQA